MGMHNLIHMIVYLKAWEQERYRTNSIVNVECAREVIDNIIAWFGILILSVAIR